MPIHEQELIAIVQNKPRLVHEKDGSLTMVFQNEAVSAWKFSVPLTQLRERDNAIVFNGELSFATDLPAYIAKHLHSSETKYDGDFCTLNMTFRGASTPESRYMRKSFENFIQNHTTGLAVSRAENCITINGTATAVSTLLKSLNEKRNEQLIEWTASTLLSQSHRKASGQSREKGLN